MHWIATGCLQYPFANDVECVVSNCILRGDARQGTSLSPLCEIAIEREGIRRALRENPLALNTILDEMTLTLASETREQLPEGFDNEYFAAPEK